MNENMFRLPTAISCCEMKYNNDSFRLNPEKGKVKRDFAVDKKSMSVSVLYKQNTNAFFRCPSLKSGINEIPDEGYNSLTKNQTRLGN